MIAKPRVFDFLKEAFCHAKRYRLSERDSSILSHCGSDAVSRFNARPAKPTLQPLHVALANHSVSMTAVYVAKHLGIFESYGTEGRRPTP
jgi:hypothetical protein